METGFSSNSEQGLLLLEVFHAVKRYSGKNDEALEYKLEVRIDSKECQAVSQTSEDQHSNHCTLDLSNTSIE